MKNMRESKPIEELTTERFQESVLPIMERAFNFPDSMFNIFPSQISFRMIDDSFGLTPMPGLLNGLKAVSLDEGTSGFYYVILTHDGPDLNISIPPKYAKSWYIQWEDAEEIENIVSPLCYAMLSPNASWGLFSSWEDFLLLGATEKTGKAIQKVVPNIVDESLKRFMDLYRVKYEKLGYDWDWMIPRLLQHLFGEQPELLEKGFALYQRIVKNE